MAKTPAKYKQKRMIGQDPRSEGMYRFSGDFPNMRMHPEDARISEEIEDRDFADIRKAQDTADSGKKPSKLELMAHRDAVDRLNRSGIAVEGTNRDTSKGYSIKEGDATRKRLIEKYAKEAPKTKKMAKGGTASKRADGCATKGKTKGRFV